MKLDDYQLEAVEKMHNGCILCGEVGSGKSRTAIAYFWSKVCGGSLDFYNEGFEHGPYWRKLYIITTAKKRDSLEWRQEVSGFAIFPDEYVVDSWNNIAKYTNVCGAFFIFDEQRLIGSGAWVKAFYQIAKKNKWVVLSATPGDVWMDYVPIFIANGFYKNRTEFVRRHVVFNRFVNYPKVQYYVDVERLVYLKQKILVKMRYIKKTTVHDLYYYSDYDINLYDQIDRERWNPFEHRPVRDAGESCRLLRKLVNSDPSKIEAFKTQALKYPKLIVFYNFDYELEDLRKCASELNIPYAEWNGHKHMPIPSGQNWLYLVQYMAGSEGWNCIATDAILFYSPSYSFKQMHQAAGRIDRRNTPYQDLYSIHLVTRSTIDDAIFKAYSEKRDFNEERFYSRAKHGI